MSIIAKKKLKMSSSSSTLKNGGIRSGDEMLPDEMMELIIGKLMGFPKDLARFSAVCKRWHRHLCTVWPELVHQIPPMALIPVVGSKEEEEFGIYNLTGGGAGYVCSLPDGTDRIIGSSFGWLILTDDIYQNSVSLFNPFSKSHIRLPPFPNNPRCLMKGVLSKPPEDNTHFDVAITMDPDCNTVITAKMIAFLHVDGELEESLQWVYEKNPKYGILDVNSIGGRICILYSNGNISCYSCNCNSTYYYGVRKEWDDSVMVSTGGGHFATVHLVESSSTSDPLVVFRYIAYGGAYTSSRKVIGFKILSLTNSNWTAIKTLDNDVLFISDLTSTCVQADSKKHQHARSIYFPYDETNFCVYNMDQNYLNLFPNRLVADTQFLPRKPGQPFWLHPSSYDLKFSSIDQLM